MRTAFITLALLLTVNSIFSQDFYIGNNNDTVRGTVLNYKEWGVNPTEVQFKVASSGTTIQLTPLTCRSLMVGNEDKYISYSGSRISSPDNIRTVPGVNTGRLQRDTITIFLREIYQYKGYALYKLKDSKRTNFYMAKGGAIKELEYYEYMNENNSITPYNAYKEYLKQQMSSINHDAVERRLQKLTYSENRLIDFFAAVLQDQDKSSENKRNKYPSKFYAGAGIGMSGGKISSEAQSIDATYTSSSIAPVLELGGRFYSQRNFGKLFFQPALRVTAFNHSFDITDQTQYKTKVTMVSVILSAGYYFRNDERVSIYGMLGGGLHWFPKYENKFIIPATGHEEKVSNHSSRLSGHPELGVLVGRHLNIALAGSIPFKLPFYSNTAYKYSIWQTALMVRYFFGK